MEDIEPIAGYPNKRAMLEAMYVKEGLSIPIIARRLGLGTTTIVRWLHDLQVPTRAPGGDNTRAKLGWRLHRLDPRVVFRHSVRQLAGMVAVSEAYTRRYRKGVTRIWTFAS
jgi:transposase-like protein